jgi:hypothetical protein
LLPSFLLGKGDSNIQFEKSSMRVSFARLVVLLRKTTSLFLVAYAQPKGAYKATRAVCAASTTAAHRPTGAFLQAGKQDFKSIEKKNKIFVRSDLKKP